MNAFLREHARPLIGSALLHVAVAAAVIAAALVSVAPRFVQPPAIEAYLAPAPRAHVGVAAGVGARRPSRCVCEQRRARARVPWRTT